MAVPPPLVVRVAQARVRKYRALLALPHQIDLAERALAEHLLLEAVVGEVDRAAAEGGEDGGGESSPHPDHNAGEQGVERHEALAEDRYASEKKVEAFQYCEIQIFNHH